MVLCSWYEIAENEDPYVFFLNEFKSKDPQSGVAMLPKWCCDVMKCETTRIAKLTPQGSIVPVKFEVPRKDNHFFQEDLFPDTLNTSQPSMTIQEWLNGENKPAISRSLNPEKK